MARATRNGKGTGMTGPNDPTIRQLRRLLEMQSAARHGMTAATLGGADPAETAFIEEELDRMAEIHRTLDEALSLLEAGRSPAEAAPLAAALAELRQQTPWASSDLLDRFIRTYGGE